MACKAFFFCAKSTRNYTKRKYNKTCYFCSVVNEQCQWDYISRLLRLSILSNLCYKTRKATTFLPTIQFSIFRFFNHFYLFSVSSFDFFYFLSIITE